MVRFRGGLPSQQTGHGRRTLTSRYTGSAKSWQHYMRMFVVVLMMIGMFYAGVLSGLHATSSYSSPSVVCDDNHAGAGMALTKEEEEHVEMTIQRRVKEALDERGRNEPSLKEWKPKKKEARFPSEMKDFVVGMSKTKRSDFLAEFDYGQATFDNPQAGSEDVLILYSSDGSLPTALNLKDTAKNENGDGIPYVRDPKEATQNCDAMNVITVNHRGGARQCLAVMTNYESFHLQRWMRVGDKNSKSKGLDPSNPLRHVSRGMKNNGADEFTPPTQQNVDVHWAMLRRYLNTFDDVITSLRPIAQSAARDNTIVVMVCNFGQSALLMNFACNAKAKNVDLGNVLVFATDQETLKVAKGLGMKAFYDEHNFQDLPSSEAKRYGDSTFVAMMYAKVICVQLINYLGYDLLFQDVDIVWNSNPLNVFHDPKSPLNDFDIMFQDDGARSVRYAPYSANSGFYYVRNNARTKYLFTSLLYQGDLIIHTHSHQAALSALLVEHASLYGLKVKTLDGYDFPGGFHFHRKKDYMMQVAKGEVTPAMFHMSWTENKDNKLKFLKQMGMWHLQDKCHGDTLLDIINQDTLMNDCCSNDYLFSCHYRDKPSVKPCNTSPSIDANGKPFWPVEIGAI